jgi:hypothetical protein
MGDDADAYAGRGRVVHEGLWIEIELLSNNADNHILFLEFTS